MDTEETKGQPEEKDKVIRAIGEFGKWHIILLLLFSCSAKLPAVITQQGIIFLAGKTTFTCIERTSSEEVESSTCYDDCIGYNYTSEFVNTIISEWDLICDRAWLSNFSQMMVMFGVLVGSVFFGFLADRCGRRPGILVAGTLQLATNLATPFCTSFWMFVIVRFVLGTATAGSMVISFVILIEITGSRYREIVSCLVSMPVPIGQVLMPGIAYYLREWDKFSLGAAVPSVLCLAYFFVVSESPKWLISVGRLEEAGKVMTSAAKCNKLPTENMLEIAKRVSEEEYVDPERKTKASFVDLVTVPSLRLRTLCSCVIWLLLGLTFYGVNQYIGQTSSSVFLSVAIAGVLQIPGILLSGLLCHRLGRRKTLMGLFVISGVSNALLAVPQHWFYVKLVAGSIGVSCASGAFTSMYMFTTELFPTVARNMAMGASSTTSRIGSMIAPFIAGLSVNLWIPPLVFGAASLIAAGTCYCLPETRGEKLADRIDQ